MVKNINKLKGKIIENEFTFKELSSKLKISEITLRRKINDDKSEFSLSESLKIKNLLKLSTKEYIDIFFGTELEFNS